VKEELATGAMSHLGSQAGTKNDIAACEHKKQLYDERRTLGRVIPSGDMEKSLGGGYTGQ